MNDIYIIYLFVFSNIVLFFLGFIIRGFISVNSGYTKPDSFFNQQQKTNQIKPKLEIDSTKVVTQISTDNLQKKYESLGDTKQSDENISGSIDKLKNLKK